MSRMEDLERRKVTDRLWDILARLAVPLVIAVGGWAIHHEVRLSAIEGNRFTDRDAREMERRIAKSIPPKWLQDDIKAIKALLTRFDDRLRAIESKVR